MSTNVGPFQRDALRTTLSYPDAPPDLILGSLLRSEGYQRFFVEQLDRFLQGALADDVVLSGIDRIAGHVAPDIPEEIAAALADRPPASRPDVATWQNAVEELREFTRGRGAQVRSFVVRSPEFTLTRAQRASPSVVSPDEETRIQIRGVGFTPETDVLFAGLRSPDVRFESDTRLDALLPYDLRVEGKHTAIARRDERVDL